MHTVKASHGVIVSVTGVRSVSKATHAEDLTVSSFSDLPRFSRIGQACAGTLELWSGEKDHTRGLQMDEERDLKVKDDCSFSLSALW